MKSKWATVAVVGLAGLGFAGPAAAQTRQQFSGTFTAKEPGASTGYRVAIEFVNPADPAGKPHALQQLVHTLHAGTRIDTSVPPRCEARDAELIVQGATACAESTRVGGGELIADIGIGAGPVPRLIENRVSIFNAAGQLIVFTESTNTPGAPIRTSTRVAVGEGTLTAQVAPIPAFPGPDPFLALKRYQVVLEPVSAAGGGSFITTPPSCPLAGAWTNAGTFTYRDGVTETVTSDSPCSEKPAAAKASAER